MMVGPLDPDTFDPAVLREQASLLDAFAAQKRQRADWIELEIIIAALGATDETGKRGIDKLLALDPMAGLTILRQLYARFAALALQLAARD